MVVVRERGDMDSVSGIRERQVGLGVVRVCVRELGCVKGSREGKRGGC